MNRFLLAIIFLFFSHMLLSQEVVSKDHSSFHKTKFENIQIYPNPTSDLFYFKNDESITTIVLYNIIGKEVKRYTHTEGTAYSVVDLQKGIYIVRIFDNKKKVLKVMRLNRK